MRRTPTLTVLAAALALASVTVACSSEEGAGPRGPGRSDAGGTTTTSEPRLDIDPRSYFEDYAPADEEMAATGGAPATTTAVPAPAPSGSARAAAGSLSAEADSAGDAIAEPVPTPPAEPGITEDNTFVDPGANPFVAAAQDAESTFALDVDTGSYSVGRTFLDQGLTPPPESVRVEEWVNAFGYGDEPPADDAEGAAADVAVSAEGAPAPFTDDGTQLVRVGIRARDVAKEDRPDAHLTLVVDTSGSMDIRERLGLVRSTLALLALELRDTDTVSVVTYSDASTVLLPPTPAADAQRIVDVIEQLVPQGSTNMEAGLRAGYEQARSTFDPEAINTVVLASDGVANTGLTGTDPLSEFVREQGAEGINLVTVGYGMGNYNDDLMEQLADRGDGFYSYVDTYEEAERLFTTELTSTLTVVAEDAKAQVTFDPEAVESYRLVGYENRAIADDAFEDDTVDAGELGAGHAVTALYELRLVDDGPDELGTVTLRHRPVGGSSAVSQDVAVTRDDLADSWAEASDSLRLAGDVAAFAEILAASPITSERGVTFDRLAALEELSGAADSSGEGEGDEAEPSGRPGFAELAGLVELARQATGGTVPPGEPVPLPQPVPTVTSGPAPR
jgi:Ca-activated chloride channel homolog